MAGKAEPGSVEDGLLDRVGNHCTSLTSSGEPHRHPDGFQDGRRIRRVWMAYLNRRRQADGQDRKRIAENMNRLFCVRNDRHGNVK